MKVYSTPYRTLSRSQMMKLLKRQRLGIAQTRGDKVLTRWAICEYLKRKHKGFMAYEKSDSRTRSWRGYTIRPQVIINNKIVVAINSQCFKWSDKTLAKRQAILSRELGMTGIIVSDYEDFIEKYNTLQYTSNTGANRVKALSLGER